MFSYEEEPSKKIVEVKVGGKDENIFIQKRQALLSRLSTMVDSLLDQTIDPVTNTTLRNEAKETWSMALGHMKARLAKTGIENDRALAQIEETYAKIEKTKAEQRKLHAEAEAIAFRNKMKNLQMALGATKIALMQDQSEEGLLFTRQLDAWLALIQSIQST